MSDNELYIGEQFKLQNPDSFNEDYADGLNEGGIFTIAWLYGDSKEYDVKLVKHPSKENKDPVLRIKLDTLYMNFSPIKEDND